MNELSWKHSNSFQRIFESLTRPISARKLRLCAVATLRNVAAQLDTKCQQAVACAERIAEGHTPTQDIKAASRGVESVVNIAKENVLKNEDVVAAGEYNVVYVINTLPILPLASALYTSLSSKPYEAESLAAAATAARASAAQRPNRKGLARYDEELFQCALLRDIFGNPFRPVAFDPAWRTDTAVAIARQMYESREFGAMPILADALQDAGCEDEQVLNHCRDANHVHVRGCWVCDAVLSLG